MPKNRIAHHQGTRGTCEDTRGLSSRVYTVRSPSTKPGYDGHTRVDTRVYGADTRVHRVDTGVHRVDTRVHRVRYPGTCRPCTLPRTPVEIYINTVPNRTVRKLLGNFGLRVERCTTFLLLVWLRKRGVRIGELRCMVGVSRRLRHGCSP